MEEKVRGDRKKILKKKLKDEIYKMLDEVSDSQNETTEKTKENLDHSIIASKLNEIVNKHSENLKHSIQDSLNQFHEEAVQMIKSTLFNKEEKKGSKEDRHYYTEKKFGYRDSLLSVQFNTIPEIQTIYNICFAILILLFANLVINDYLEEKSVFHYQDFFFTFSGLGDCMNMLMLMTIYSLLIIPFAKIILIAKLKAWVWGPFYALYLIALLFISGQRAFTEKYSCATTMVITCESARIFMKTHSYLRNKLLYCQPNQYSGYVFAFAKGKNESDSQIYIPEFKMEDFFTEVKKFVYFLFAPTLIYRDSYCLRRKRDYSNLIYSFFNFMFCIYFGFLLFRVFILPTMIDYQNKKFILITLKLIMPSLFCLMLVFFGILHSWFNMWSEVLLFPDRLFYEDWWNSLEYGTYYRKWNIVVHEWLYFYLYLDVLRFSKEKISRNKSQLITFLVSALIHEFILTYTIGFFFPALFVIFIGPGVVFIRNSRGIKKKEMNILFWLTLFIGTSLLLVMYIREYQVRQFILDEKVYNKYGFSSFFIPRSLLVILDSDFRI